MKTNYTYEKYLALHEICEGKTTHNLSWAGFGPWNKDKLSKEDFEGLNRRSQELENQDEEEWIAKNQDDYMTVAEAEAEE